MPNHQNELSQDVVERGSLIAVVICVCSKKDIETWEHASKYIVKNIQSTRYLVVVPDIDVKAFVHKTEPTFQVVAESQYIGNLKSELEGKMLNSVTTRLGWYLQQFIKLSVLQSLEDDELALLWDADTVPLKPLKFVSKDGKIVYYSGKEYHKPYFHLIRSLLGMEKVIKNSFVAQCFPVRGIWAREFFQYIESRHKKKWQQAIIDLIDFNESSGFSEYETMGTFISNRYTDQITITKKRWLRSGNSYIKSINNLKKFHCFVLLKPFDFVSFELWDIPGNRLYFLLREFLKPAVKNIRSYLKKDLTVTNFLEMFFLSSQEKTIVQIGANYGIQNDPIRKFLINQGNYKAVLVEPIPYYVSELQSLYKGRSDVQIIQSAIGSSEGFLLLYFIPPEIAETMNGDGPENNWAHGQGSFDKDVVMHWIDQNSFRGETYKSRIPHYKASVASVKIPMQKTMSVIPHKKNVLVMIDVQGYETEVLKGIDFDNNAPDFIIVEDDLEARKQLHRLLKAHNYRFLGGQHDRLYALKNALKNLNHSEQPTC